MPAPDCEDKPLISFGVWAKLPIRSRMAGMMAALAETLNRVAFSEQVGISRLAQYSDIDPDSRLSRSDLEARAALIRKIAPTKAVMLAAQELLTDYSTWRLPELQVETADRSETHPVLARSLSHLTARHTTEFAHQPFETILRWALTHASDAPYVSYCADCDQVLGRYMVMTREEEFLFGDQGGWRAKMVALRTAEGAAPAPGNAGRDEDDSPSPASYGGL
ncbi:hypothetical protein [Alcanivorax sp. 1008]|uniref:hypothetical protein n=1 Tax=Alcanivorax sp. 1008 TaxID=2816853 RepID=UPI001D9819D1|nr:hypothetical protein [Alcanivorax sp. 1008]MCC1496876.1 hypothetical protein [Alcanivorax sp. 1008]